MKLPDEDSDEEEPPAPSRDLMSLSEKLGRWAILEPSQNTATAAIEQQVAVEELPGLHVISTSVPEVPPRYQEVRSFLMESPAYRWLLLTFQSSLYLSERRGTCIENISRSVDEVLNSTKDIGGSQPWTFRVTFNLDWNVLEFLRGQQYDTTLGVAIESAITLTGSAENAQALTCADYMCNTWPSSGHDVLKILQKALDSPDYTASGK
jgi:hypothetical protein